jgi:transmembrane sensor
MQKIDAKILLTKYRLGEATEQEKTLVESWYAQYTENGTPIPIERVDEIGNEIWTSLPIHQPQRRIVLWPRIVAAASVLVFLAIGGYLLLKKSPGNKAIAFKQPAVKIDVAPGGNNAILTLANGQNIVLNSAKNGALVRQGNVTVNKAAEGELVYTESRNGAGKYGSGYNVVSTPRGGQYHLVLADGTNVWLNAASSLKYPTAFNGNDRTVELTGEAYFEVIHNNAKPFRIATRNETVEDIGTHFNIYAYADETAVKTTLLEGSAMVSASGKNVVLKPGQQAQVSAANSGISVVNNADTEEAVAWKNGFFEFNRSDIPTVMRSLGRWYDVDIAYEGKIPQRRFTGEMHRDANLSEALKILSYLKIDFRMEGKKIIVTNQTSN